MASPSRKKASGERAANRILLVFSGAFASLLLLMLLDRRIMKGDTFLLAYHSLQVFALLSLIGAAALGAAAWMSHKNPSGKNHFPGLRQGAAVCLFFLAASLFILYGGFFTAIKVLYVVIPAFAVLYMIYYIYPTEFTCHALITVLSAAGMWLLGRGLAVSTRKAAPVFIVACVFLAACAFGIRAIGKNGGAAPWNPSLKLLPDRKGARALLYVTCLAMLLAFAAAMAGGASVAYYAVFVILGYMLLLAVYFTACLM